MAKKKGKGRAGAPDAPAVENAGQQMPGTLRASFDSVAASRSLIDIPAIVGEGRKLAAAIKGPAGVDLTAYWDSIATAETSAEAAKVARTALAYLDVFGGD